MPVDPSDIVFNLFLAVILYIAVLIINSGGGGGHRARVPAVD